MIRPVDAWMLRRLLCGHVLNGELQAVSDPFRRLAIHLGSLPAEIRPGAWEGFLCGRSDADDLVSALAEADPEGPEPEPEPPRRPASLADIRKIRSESSWRWKGWIPAAVITGIAAFEGIGKSRYAMDLARRIWLEECWPDGQDATFPGETPTLWICADGQQDELVDAAEAFGMPDEAIYFNTVPEDPYGGNSLDDPESLEQLEEFIGQVRPGLVIVDSLTFATARDLCKAHEVKTVITPLRDIAKRTQASIVLLLHLSKEGQALGRRIKGLTRVVMQLDCPDPEQPERLKLWVPKSFDKKPPPLGVTMGDKGNEYDPTPPTPPPPPKTGRPSGERDKAMSLIREALKKENDQIGTQLCRELEKKGVKEKTFWRAAEELEAAGELVMDGGPGTGQQKKLHLITDKPGPDTPY